MALNYLVGPVTAEQAWACWSEERKAGRCRAFNAAGDLDLAVGPADSWDDVCRRLPPGWHPDFVALYLPYTTVPRGLWAAPVPLAGLAADCNLLWHHYRRLLPRLELALLDAPGAEALGRAGWPHARPANLFGLERPFRDMPYNAGERDLDVLFVGNLHPAVQRERLPWLARLARLGGRWRIAVCTGVYGADYRALLSRARVVFNRSVRGECNRRVFEATAAGALLFQEAGNREVAGLLRDRRECVYYTEDDFEALLEYYLGHEDERRAVAEAGRERVLREGTFEALWAQALAQVEAELPALRDRVPERPALCAGGELLLRAGQALGAADGGDPALADDLASAAARNPQSAELHNALGLALSLGVRTTSELAARAAGHFRRAVEADPANAVHALNLVEALAGAGDKNLAARAARRVLALLERGRGLGPTALSAGRFPPGFDHFRVEWERAAWEAPGDPAAETRAKRDLVRWRLHALLASLTGDLVHYHEAVLARPDLPPARAELGCALGRAGRPAEAAAHLRRALAGNPFDRPAARALYQALTDGGDADGARRLARERRLLHRGAPRAVPEEDWFRDAPPVGDELASVLVLCCNELDYTRQCLESVLRHTRPPYELVLVDNGSSDATPAYLEELRARPGPARVEVIRNETNVGFPAGCNQALARARGRYIVFLNNDTVVTEGWLDGLVAWALFDWPQVGLVGAVTNYSRPPQQIPADYDSVEDMPAFAARRRREEGGRALLVDRLAGFCLLARREVLERLGGFDEGFGLGFFDDDDLSVRARKAGLKLAVALGVFVHHYGSRTFASLGVDTTRQLVENFGRFKAKWGEAEAAGYRLPATGQAPDAPPARVTGTLTSRARVSLCLIVKNEEANLPDCLASAADLVDEVVVVDTGSTDRTREVAAVFGDKVKVIDFPWVDSFAAARNEGLRHATGDWIFWMDADDRLDGDNREKLRALFAGLGGENAAYVMKCLCLADPVHRVETLVDHVRLFRNHPSIRWEHRVHEQILPGVRRAGGQARWTDVVVRHAGYQDTALRRRKLERDLRLLRLEEAEQPDHPFTLFNLGSVLQEMGKPTEALPCLRRSLERSHPADSIVRKLYALVVSSHRALGQPEEALAACREGRRGYPDDTELLFVEASLLEERGELEGARECLVRLLDAKPGAHFASVAAGLKGFRSRHNLAAICHRLGRLGEAEEHWRAAVAEQPGFLPGWAGLGELCLQGSRWPELESVAGRMEGLPPEGPPEAAALRARAWLARGEFAAARALLEAAVAAHPRAPGPRFALADVLLREGTDPAAAEAALRAALEVAPGHAGARQQLEWLLAQRRPEPALVVDAGGLAGLYRAACAAPTDIHEHLPTLHALARECRHVTELGTRAGNSTAAFLYAQPARLVCYDKVRHPAVGRLARLAGRTEFVFCQADVLEVEIEETDLLFIDSWHVYGQLKEELRRHGAKARRYIVLHDTTTFGERGEAAGHRGLWPAVEEFLARGTFRLKARYENNNGLTVLEAVRPAATPAPPAGRDDGDAVWAALGAQGNGALLSPASLPALPPEACQALVEAAPVAVPHSTPPPAGGPVPRVAVLCAVRDEEYLIEPFLRHHLGAGADTVFLLDDGCADRTLERAERFPNVIVADLAGDSREEALRRYQDACAGQYDFVAVLEADELLVPREGDNLPGALARHAGAAALGAEVYDVVQHEGEPPLDPAVPVLRQRRWGVRDAGQDRAVVRCPGALAGEGPLPGATPFYLFRLGACDEALFRKWHRSGDGADGRGEAGAGEREASRLWQELQNHPGLGRLPGGPG